MHSIPSSSACEGVPVFLRNHSPQELKQTLSMEVTGSLECLGLYSIEDMAYQSCRLLHHSIWPLHHVTSCLQFHHNVYIQMQNRTCQDMSHKWNKCFLEL